MIPILSLLIPFLGTAFAQAPAAPAPAPAPEAAPAPAPSAGPVTYKLDPSKSWLYVVVWNDTSSLASRLGHDHGIKATTFTGTVTWDTANAAACKVDISFPVTALAPDPPGMRARAGLSPEGQVSDKDLAKIKENFLGKSQLDAATYPEIKYQSTSCEGTTGKVKVVGNLTIHGVTKPVTMTMDVKAEPTNFAAGGAINTTVSNFGFQPFTALGGTLRNKDEIKLVVDVQGAKAQ